MARKKKKKKKKKKKQKHSTPHRRYTAHHIIDETQFSAFQHVMALATWHFHKMRRTKVKKGYAMLLDAGTLTSAACSRDSSVHIEAYASPCLTETHPLA